MGHDWNSESQAGLGSTVEIIKLYFWTYYLRCLRDLQVEMSRRQLDLQG